MRRQVLADRFVVCFFEGYLLLFCHKVSFDHLNINRAIVRDTDPTYETHYSNRRCNFHPRITHGLFTDAQPWSNHSGFCCQSLTETFLSNSRSALAPHHITNHVIGSPNLFCIGGNFYPTVNCCLLSLIHFSVH